jgi:hypothetical protein
VIKPAPSAWRALGVGMSGHDVAAWQSVLRTYPRPDDWAAAWPLTVDGRFGPMTQAATRAFQMQAHLTTTGVVGSETRAKLSPDLFAAPLVVLTADALPITFVQAREWRWVDRKTVDWIVIHSAEVWEKPSSAEAVAAYFKNPNPPASAHFTVDCDSIVQSVRTEHMAAHAGPANRRSIGIEQAGYAKQSREEWLDDYGQRMIRLVARLVARECKTWNIPLVKLTPEQMVAGERGLCGHVDVNAAFPGKSKHYDPGPHYPWDVLLQWAKETT